VGLAVDGLGERSTHATLNEPGPHAPVNDGGLRPLRHERTQWARRCADHRGVAVDSVKHRMEAKRTDRGAHRLERVLEPRSRPQPRGARELAAEILACSAECLLASFCWDLVEQARNERRKAARWDLERLLLGRGRIELCRPPRAGADAAGAPLEGRLKEPGVGQSLESAAGNAAMDAELGRGVVGGDAATRTAHVQERLAQLASADQVERFQRKEDPRPLSPSCLE